MSLPSGVSPWNSIFGPGRGSKYNKCTCVNNRWIRPRNIRIWPWLSTGWIEFEIVTLTGKRVVVKLLYTPGDRKFKSVGDQISWRENAGMRNMSQRGLAPRPPVGHKNGGQYVPVLFSFQLTSHSKTFSNPFEPFQIKWEVYFFKELCRSSSLRRYVFACICISIMWLYKIIIFIFLVIK